MSVWGGSIAAVPTDPAGSSAFSHRHVRPCTRYRVVCRDLHRGSSSAAQPRDASPAQRGRPIRTRDGDRGGLSEQRSEYRHRPRTSSGCGAEVSWIQNRFGGRSAAGGSDPTENPQTGRAAVRMGRDMRYTEINSSAESRRVSPDAPVREPGSRLPAAGSATRPLREPDGRPGRDLRPGTTAVGIHSPSCRDPYGERK